VTVQRDRRDQPPRQGWDDWDQPVYVMEETAPRGVSTYVTVILVVLALAILCGAAFLLVRLLVPHVPEVLPSIGSQTPAPTLVGPAPNQTASTAVPGQVQVRVNPTGGSINTLVTVSGEGWWPGEPVFIFLRSPQEETEHGFTYAADTADSDGRINTAFTFPNEMRWVGQDWAEVIARGSRSNLQAATRFDLLLPTATNTVPIPTLPPFTPNTPNPNPPTNTPWPTSTPLPSATPTQAAITDWRGEYFSNTGLGGQPVLVRNDVEINFTWGPGAPAANVPADGFSVRWTRTRQFRNAIYRFSATVDDGVRVYVDNQLILDEWHDSGLTTYNVDVRLTNALHTIRVEYYENVGAAVIQFGWARLEGPTATPTSPGPTVTPTSPGPTATPTAAEISDWRGEYYANASLHGQPVLVRNDFYVDFSWGHESPAEGVPADDFSVRWTRTREFRNDMYRFTVTVDDGVRVFVDDDLIIDEWHEASAATYSVELSMAEGTHALRIEYFDRVGNAQIQFGFSRIN